jgi:hypothetical protein
MACDTNTGAGDSVSRHVEQCDREVEWGDPRNEDWDCELGLFHDFAAMGSQCIN